MPPRPCFSQFLRRELRARRQRSQVARGASFLRTIRQLVTAVTASHIPWAPARALLDSGSAFRSTVLLSPFAAHRAFLAASRNRGCSVDGCAASFPGSLRPRCRPSGYRPRFSRRLLPFLLAAPVVRDSWPSTPCSPLARQHCE